MVNGANIEELPIPELDDIEELPISGDVTEEEEISFSPITTEQVSGGFGDVEETMNQLSDVNKEFVIEHLTPEIVDILGMVGGEEVFNFFQQFENSSRLLIPVDRASFFKEQGVSPQTPTTEQVAVPAEESIGDLEALNSIRLPSDEEAPQ